MKSKLLFAVLIMILMWGVGTTPTLAEELILFPGDILEVLFYMPDSINQSIGYDMFFLGSASSVTVISPFSAAHVELFDGENLLGTYTKLTYPLPAIFKTEVSVWDNGQNPTIIDFASFLDSSIDGRLLLWIESGEVRFDSDKISVGIRHALTSSSSSYFPADQPIITDISIIDDEELIQDAAVEELIETIETIEDLDPSIFPNENMSNALTNKINAAIELIDQGLYEEALDKLQNDILSKTDGCANNGSPDRNDWITNCTDQDKVYPLILEAIELLESLL